MDLADGKSAKGQRKFDKAPPFFKQDNELKGEDGKIMF